VDAVSASTTARLCDKRVEVLSARTERTQLWALPKGGYSSQMYGGPIRFKDGDAWKPVDLTLRPRPDGSVAPVGHPQGLRLSGAAGAGEHALASLDVGGDTLDMLWSGPLPTPVLSGHQATYPDVLPGVDLVLAAQRSGLEQSFVVKSREAAVHVASVTLPLRSRTLRFVGDGPGSFAIRDARNRTVGRIPTPTMWDAKRASDGDITRERAIAVAARPASSRRDAPAARRGVDAAAGTGAVALDLKPDPKWLNDPATLYPVTLDPVIDLDPSSDTFVRTDSTVDNSGASDMFFGRATWFTAQAFLQWPTEQFGGAYIRSATLHLWNYYSASCGPAGWQAFVSAPYTNPITWDTRPPFVAPGGSSDETKGLNSTCDDNFIHMNVRDFLQYAADQRAVTSYMGLKASDETQIAGWKQVRSLQVNLASHMPYITVDFDAAPFVTNPTTSPATAGCVSGTGRPWIASRTPRLQGTVTDADTANVNVTFEWAQAGSTSTMGTTTFTGVPSNTSPAFTVPAGVFDEGGTYAWRATASDGVRSGSSPWCEFGVDTAKPGVPTVSSSLYPSITTDNTWGHGGYGQAGTFTFAPATADSDVVAYTYQMDTDTASTTVTVATPTTVQITPSEDGRRTLTVRAKDRAGNLSNPNTYVFNVGRAGLKEPRPGANVVKRTKLAVDGDATFTRATFQFRRGPGAVESDIPLAQLRKADGSPVTTKPVRLSELGGPAIWDAVDTVGPVGGVVQVRAVLYPEADGQPGYQTQWTTVTVDPDGDGGSTDEIGPGTVNLLTGDYGLSSSDVDEFGLSVGRMASSRRPVDGLTPQGERLSPAQQQVSVDNTVFVASTPTSMVRHTGLGQGGSTDSLLLTPRGAAYGPSADTFAAIGGDTGALRFGMRPGKRYRATAWIYVPAATGLSPVDGRGLRITFYYNAAGSYQYAASPMAAFVDGWQQLSVDLTLPAGATEAFVRLYNGFPADQTSKAVYWDNLSLKELVAPFGPQWKGGAGGGLADVDYESLTFPSPDVAKITGADGSYLTFGRGTTGTFFPEPGAEDLDLVKVSDTVYELRELDGTVTQFTKQSETFLVSTTWTAEQNTTTRYLYDTADNRTLVKRVINATEPGVGDCTTAVPARGCQVLEYDYATTTTATATALGDHVDRVRTVKVWSWDPVAGVVSAVDVARYAYDDLGRLREVWDPRLSTPLKTTYEYDAAGRVTRIGSAGQLPWMFDYAAISGDANAGRLMRVRRAALQRGSKDQLDGEIATTIVYRVPLTRGAGGPHDLDAAAIATWGQKDLPTDVTAVFGPESVPTTNVASSTAPGPNGYGLANLTYLNASGQTVNTAVPGNYIDSQTYDEHGNVVWSLQATNRDLALGLLPDAATKAAELNLPADSVQRAALLASVSRYSPDGLDLLETTGPVTKVALERALADPTGVLPTLEPGTHVVARGHTTHVYDEGKPDGADYHLETTERSGAAVSGYPDADVRVARTGYDPQPGTASGWELKKDTSTTTDAGTARTTYDGAGRVLRSWGIGSNGSDARATETIYYTAGANGADASCGNRPEWAGQPCVTRALGPVTGHDPTRATTELSVKRVEEYSRFGEPSTVAETAGGKTRRTTTVYNGADRVTSVSITSDDGAVPLGAVVTEYDPATGLPWRTTAGASTITREYDLLGRVLTYTDADGGVTRSEYDRFGKPAKVTDNTGWTTYAYDRTLEPRGLLTSVTDSIAGTFSARYSPDGQLTEMRYPGGVTRTDTLDANFAPVQRVYKRDSDATVLYAESIVENTAGQWIDHTYTGGSRTYGYDTLGRLTSVQQLTGALCHTRTYAYDARTNRTAKRTYAPGPTGCQAETPTSEVVHTYDTADRTADAGYVHDAFGRVTSLPGGLTTTYHANDLVAGQQLGDTRQNWTLDPALRPRGFTTSTFVSGAWTNASSKLNHYGDDSDEPRWIVEDTSLGSLTRNVSGPDSDLVATTSATGDVRLQVTNLHGDVALTIDTGLTSPEAYAYDEFGIPAGQASDRRYGWLGGKQRSSEALGDIMLMGVRLYSPSLGRFLQVDPEPGGNSNAYDYCSGDPVNCTDLDGKWGWGSIKKALNKVATVASYASMIPGPIGTIAGVVSAVAYVATGNWKEAAWAVAGAAAAVVGAGAAVKGARLAVGAIKAAKRTKCNSFAPGTPVLLADGGYRDIDALQVGDEVLAVDPATGRAGARPVVDTIVGQGTRELVDLTVDGAARPLVATAGHPIWVVGRGWVAADRVHTGDRLLTPNGRTAAVTAVRARGSVAAATVHNLNVADLHTYVVLAGSTPVVVHNCATQVWNGFRVPKRSKVASRSGHGNAEKTHVYEIGYRKGGRPDVFKYGIATGKINKNIRTRIGVAKCTLKMRVRCRVTGMQSKPTRYQARLHEWKKCVSYTVRKGRTPYGMTSCR
jgi:RHS repeat-associated protein